MSSNIVTGSGGQGIDRFEKSHPVYPNDLFNGNEKWHRMYT